ncbi:MAG: triose-phosphate isomerase [Pseudomonadota bacterium]
MAGKLAAGNWKMNGLGSSLSEIDALTAAHPSPSVDVLICPPATLLARMAEATKGNAVKVGGQDCHTAGSGAHTGDISAEMLSEAGASHVILGHSERRADHGESDALVAEKAKAADAAGLVPIICVGETLDEREAGKTLDVVGGQLAGSVPGRLTSLVIAYEPVWAIGTGKVPTLEEIGEVHAFIRAELAKIEDVSAAATPILYGGSVKPSNASEIFTVADVDGALVGGASLKAADFSGIVSALEKA